MPAKKTREEIRREQEAKELSQTLIRSNREVFETCVLACSSRNEVFWNKTSRVICKDHVSGSFVADFDDIYKSALYKSLSTMRSMYQGADFVPIVDRSIVEANVSSMLQAGMLLTLSAQDLPAIMEVYDKMHAVDAGNALMLVEPAWTDWIINTRGHRMLENALKLGDSIEEHIERVQDLKYFVREADNNLPTIINIRDVDMDEEIVDRILFAKPLLGLNKVFGGGLGKGELAIFVIPSGGGKTVLACQIGASVADMGKRALIISTEQPPRELLPRIVSARSRLAASSGMGNIPQIPFELIKDGGLKKLGSEAARNGANKILQDLDKNLHFSLWRDMGTVKDTINYMIKECERINGPVDVVIFDWLGGAADDVGSAESSAASKHLLDIATSLSDIAKERNIATVSFAQTTTAARKKTIITQEDIALGKNIIFPATVVCGISHTTVTNKDTEKAAVEGADMPGPGDYESTVSSNQTLHAIKARKSKDGLMVPVVCQFAFQLMEIS